MIRSTFVLPLVIAALESWLAVSAQAQQSEATPYTVAADPAETGNITVTILGSGTPTASATQAGPAILVQAGGRNFLFDCGRGCTTRLMQYDPALLTKIDAVFLTHLHSDHVTGLPDLWLNGWAQGRETPLPIYGPIGSENVLPGLRAAYADDIVYRLADGAPANADGLADATQTVPDSGGIIYDMEGVNIAAFPVEHGATRAFGYRIEQSEQTIVLSGDTTDTPTLVDAAEGADLLLLEVLSPAMVSYLRRSFASDMAERIIGLHMTATQTAALLAESNPKLGVYYHTVNNPASAQGLLETTARHYDGDVLVSSDLMTITVGPDGVCSTFADGGEVQCATGQ